MWVFFIFNVVHVNIYEAQICILFILELLLFFHLVFSMEVCQKQNCKNNCGWYLWQTFRNSQGKWKVRVS